MKQLITSLLLFCTIMISGQNKTIGAGEKLVFSATYNMSGLLNEIAQVTMETSEVKTSKRTLLKLKCTAATYSKWDSFFKIRDLYESYVNPSSLKPYLHNRDIYEGGYEKRMKYKFNHKSQIAESEKRKKNREGKYWTEKKKVRIGSGTKDLVSTLYYIRSLDIHKASIGDRQNFTIIFDNEETDVTITYVNKETINTALGRKECYKLSIGLANNNVLQGSQNNLIWITADQNKIPVYAKFKIPVGNGELKIKSATGLKY